MKRKLFFFCILLTYSTLTAGAVEVTHARKNQIFICFFARLIGFDSRAVEDTPVREISKFFWISARLIVTLQAEQDIECWE